MKKRSLSGISGWLSFYVVFLVILFFSLLFSALSIISNENFKLNFFVAFLLFINGALLIQIFNSFTTIFSEDKKAVLRNKVMLWFWFGTNIFFDLLFIITSFNEGEGILSSLYIMLFESNSLILALIAVGWILYWNKSKRVINTFLK